MRPTVRWFKNDHEHRNYWLRFGLMRLHRAGQIRYREEPLARCVTAGFSNRLAQHQHRHTSVISVEAGGEPVRCIVDSEDSFFCMAHIIGFSDRYFCAGYNTDFFQHRNFKPPYAWLNPHETAFYRRRAAEIIADQGEFFVRVRPFVPIGPDLTRRAALRPIEQKLRNVHDKLTSRLLPNSSWHFAHADFENRYASLLALRNAPATHDIVLLDTLWGWPRHRLALHRRLGELSADGRDIHSRLNWSRPSHWDGSDLAPLDKAGFPICSGQVGDYEPMLAASRLAVFASGFHWGWRNIMTLAMMLGLPILADRPFLEPWFDLDRFDIGWNDHANWDDLASALECMTAAERHRIAGHNQSAFDALLAPEKVAEYFVTTALG